MISSCVAKKEEAVKSTSGKKRTPGFVALVSMLAILVSVTLSMSVRADEASASLIKMGGWGGGQGRQQPVPQALAHDSQGRILIADSGTGRVVRIETDGSINLSWDVGAPTGDPDVSNPVDIAIDDDDNIYVLNQETWQVKKYGPDGTSLTSWIVPQQLENAVYGIAAEAGSVFVTSSKLVHRFDPDGQLLDTWGGFETYEWNVPPLIRGDSDGNLVVTGTKFGEGNHSATKSIYRFKPDGELISKWTTPAEIFYRTDSCGDGCDYEVIDHVEGFTGIAPLPSGNVMTTTGEDNFITEYGASGPAGEQIGQQGNGRVPQDLAMTPGGDLYFTWFGWRDFGTAGSWVTKLDSSREVVREWSGFDFPKYTNDFLEGKFDRAEDLAVRSDGVVGSFDSTFGRAQLFDANGNFLDRIETPDVSPPVSWESGVLFTLPDSGGVELFQRVFNTMFSYDEAGVLIKEKQLEVGGRLLDVSTDRDSGHLALTFTNGGYGKVSFLDQDEAMTDSFTSKRPVDETESGGSQIETNDAGQIYVASRGYIEKYSRSGGLLASWDVPKYSCRQYVIDDLAVDHRGSVYALVARGRRFLVLKFGSSLAQKWEEPAGPISASSLPTGYMDVGPDGSIYLDLGQGIERFDQSEASAQPVAPDCPKPRVAPMTVPRVKYFRGRTVARLKVKYSERGRILVSGRSIVSQKRRVSSQGTRWIPVRIKPRIVRNRERRKLMRVPVKVTFSGQTRRNTRHLVLRMRIRAR